MNLVGWILDWIQWMAGCMEMELQLEDYRYTKMVARSLVLLTFLATL